jgi:hypothetical protein
MHSPKRWRYSGTACRRSQVPIGIIRWRYGFADKALRPASKVTQVFEAKRHSPPLTRKADLSKLFAH